MDETYAKRSASTIKCALIIADPELVYESFGLSKYCGTEIHVPSRFVKIMSFNLYLIRPSIAHHQLGGGVVLNLAIPLSLGSIAI